MEKQSPGQDVASFSILSSDALDGHHATDIVPRPARRRRRARSDRGLPDDQILRQLAERYLKEQHKHFPDLVAAGIVPAITDEKIDEMVGDFKARHRGDFPSLATIADIAAKLRALKLGAGYFRYSCDNSKPTSIEDQMVNALRKAHDEARFIPWSYVYADFSVSGLDASRQGYSALKKLMANAQHAINTLYVDDFTRPSRDELEWWRLAQLVQKLRKRMIGASDQFDLDNPHWDLQLTIFGLLSRLFIKSLRQKVSRGMRGAVSRGGSVGKLALGFTRRGKLDAAGQPIFSPGGGPQREICIDPVTAESRLLMYRLFVNENCTLQRIAQHFCQLEIDGWAGWTTSAVRKLLHSPTAIGVFCWHKTTRVFDPETERWETVKNPREEWIVRYDRQLAIVPLELWRAARRKLQVLKQIYGPRWRGRNRNQVAPTTLFSGTLYCACCNEELKLVRSVGHLKQLGSLSGIHRAHKCQLTTSKSVRQIEAALLGCLRDQLLTPHRIRQLVKLANEALEAESQTPPPNLAPLTRRADQIRKQVQRLVRRSAETDDAGVAASYEGEIKKLRGELVEIEPQLRAAQATEQRRHVRLDETQAQELLKNLEQVLNQDVAIAGPAIRELTGAIRIRQEPHPGAKHRYRWIAEFTPQVSALLAKVSGPAIGTTAKALRLAPPEMVSIVIDEVPRYERLAAEIKALHDSGVSINAIAAKYNIPWQQVKVTLKFAETGERPSTKRKHRKKSKGNGRKHRGCYLEVGPEVVQLRDKEHLTFPAIAEKLGISAATASRAYDHLRPDLVAKRVASGPKRFIAALYRLPRSTFETITRLHMEGLSVAQIATAVGCSQNTVRRQIKQPKT